MDKRYGYIYIHKNKENGHVYIGQSIQAPERRFRKGDKNFNSYKTCPAFYAALQKYGWEGFTEEIIAWADSQQELNALEEKYINEYNSANGKDGYNSNWFSEGRGKQAESTKKLISEKAKSRKGKMGPAKNRKEYKIINGVTLKHCSGKDHWVPIIQFNNNASKWDKLNMYCAECQAVQSREQKNKRKTLLTEEEVKQSYIDRALAMSEGLKNRYIEDPEYRLKNSKAKSQPIICIDPNTGDTKEYASGLAAKADGFDNTYVSQACKSGKLFKGFRWIKKETGPKRPRNK